MDLYIPPKPALIQAGEPWEARLASALAWRGVRPHKAAAIVAEVKRLVALGPVRPAVLRPGLDDLARFGGGERSIAPILSHAMRRAAGNSAAPLVLTYINSASSSTDASSYNFGDFTIPEAGLVVVGTCAARVGSGSLSSISIGGTNGDLTSFDGANGYPNGFGRREVAAGDHNVTVTFGSSVLRCAASVWLLTGYGSTTPADSDNDPASGSESTKAISIDIGAGGVAVYICMANTGASHTWTDATEDHEVSVEARYSSAHYAATAAETHAASVALATSTLASMSGMSFNP